MKNQIINYILNNQIINDYLSKVEYTYRDDFKQHIWLTIMELLNNKYEYILNLYEKDELGKYIMGIIHIQLKKNNSRFNEIHKEISIINNTYHKRTIYKPDFNDMLLIDEEIELQEDPHITILKILHELENTYPYHAVLYKLYRGIDPITNEIVKPKTYREIKELVGLNYNTIRYAVVKVDNAIKLKLKK